MTLDPRPSDAELLRRYAERHAATVRRIQRNVRQFEGDVKEIARQENSGGQAAVEEVMGGGRGFVPPKELERATKPDWWDPRMNHTEERYAETLAMGQKYGTVRKWKYEPFSMRLAPRTYYRPDFLVQLAQEAYWPRLEIHEVKGFWREDARAKFKIAAELYPMFVFRAVRRVRGEFHIIETLNA